MVNCDIRSRISTITRDLLCKWLCYILGKPEYYALDHVEVNISNLLSILYTVTSFCKHSYPVEYSVWHLGVGRYGLSITAGRFDFV